MSRPRLPPFTPETAVTKVRMAEDAWNTRDPARVALAYTPDSCWRNRAEFLTLHMPAVSPSVAPMPAWITTPLQLPR